MGADQEGAAAAAAVPYSVTAGEVTEGQVIRIEDGPMAGTTGTVEHVTLTTQFRTNYRIAIIDLVGGTRTVRLQSDPVTILRLSLPTHRAAGDEDLCARCGVTMPVGSPVVDIDDPTRSLPFGTAEWATVHEACET